MSTNSSKYARIAAGFLVSVAGALALPAFAAPVTVAITVPSGAQEPANLAKDLSAWRTQDKINRVYRLDTKESNPEFQTLVIMEFADEAAHKAWASSEGAKLRAPLVVSEAKVLKQGDSPIHDPSNSAFRINVYTPTVDHTEFQTFIDGYMVPLLEAQCDKGIMWDYAMYMVKDAKGVEKTIWILEYKDDAAYNGRGDVKRAIKADLMARSAVFTKYRTLHPSLREINANFTTKLTPIR